jgi:plasmid maintenance system antidote protein VapI
MTAQQEPESFHPDWISPPGDTIRDIMDECGISRRKLACMLDESERNVIALINGDFYIDNDMATRLSEKLGSSVAFWENRERQYREALSEWERDRPKQEPEKTDESWYRSNAICCPKCGHFQRDYINESDVGWHGCRKHYRSKCEKCGFNGWVPEELRSGIDAD